MGLRSLVALISLPAVALGWAPHVSSVAVKYSNADRCVSPIMKGKGSRGMPKKATAMGTTVNKGLKEKMMKKDFDQSDDWVVVMEREKEELGSSKGSGKAVQAGKNYMGQEFLWNVVRASSRAEDQAPEDTVVYAVDGACRVCQFPLTNANLEGELGGEKPQELSCPLCGTKWEMDGGECVDFLPAKNPVQYAAKLANEKKGPQKLAILPTRVSKSGRVWLRLPDGTLK